MPVSWLHCVYAREFVALRVRPWVGCTAYTPACWLHRVYARELVALRVHLWCVKFVELIRKLCVCNNGQRAGARGRLLLQRSHVAPVELGCGPCCVGLRTARGNQEGSLVHRTGLPAQLPAEPPRRNPTQDEGRMWRGPCRGTRQLSAGVVLRQTPQYMYVYHITSIHSMEKIVHFQL